MEWIAINKQTGVPYELSQEKKESYEKDPFLKGKYIYKKKTGVSTAPKGVEATAKKAEIKG